MLTTHPIKLFFKYAIPSILGLLAISSASIIDGYFIGNYVGPIGLAAINISYPFLTILFGFALMFAVGSSVMVGKLMGEKKQNHANEIFSQSLMFIGMVSLLICGLLYTQIEAITSFMNLSEALAHLTFQYMHVALIFLPFLMTGIVLDYFVRVDENPNLSFIALLLSAGINVVLDYVFVVKLNAGMQGAAYATGISQALIVFMLIPHFFLKNATLKFVFRNWNFKNIFHASKNGLSEFINESSVGITVLIFNAFMLKHFGDIGVASYTIVGYVIMVSIMISFAISDSLQPIVSKNFGATHIHRIKTFLALGLASILVIESIIALIVWFFPQNIVHIFLTQNNQDTIQITLTFLTYAWPAFILAGINILITSYLTSVQKPLYSAVIAISRSLVLPLICISILPLYFPNVGIFMAVSVAEAFTLVLAVYFYIKISPDKLLH